MTQTYRPARADETLFQRTVILPAERANKRLSGSRPPNFCALTRQPETFVLAVACRRCLPAQPAAPIVRPAHGPGLVFNLLYLISMRLLLIIAGLALACGVRPAAAQGTRATPEAAGSAQSPIALATRGAASARPMRLACAPLLGVVFEPNGQPLVGATLLVKGTHQVYVTDSEGKFQLTDAIYQGQELTVGAAGYRTQDIALEDCSLPRLVLEKLPGAYIKRTGKRAGQVIRLNNRSTNMR